MTARNPAAHYVAELSKDKGFVGATVNINPKLWSARKRNIILNALENGVTQCGEETAWFIQALTRAYGGTMTTINAWSNNVSVAKVRDDKLDDLIAYTCAWIKIALANQTNRNRDWELRSWLDDAGRDRHGQMIPLPDIGHADKVAFIKQYLKDDDNLKDVRQAIANRIERGELLSIYVEAV